MANTRDGNLNLDCMIDCHIFLYRFVDQLVDQHCLVDCPVRFAQADLTRRNIKTGLVDL